MCVLVRGCMRAMPATRVRVHTRLHAVYAMRACACTRAGFMLEDMLGSTSAMPSERSLQAAELRKYPPGLYSICYEGTDLLEGPNLDSKFVAKLSKGQRIKVHIVSLTTTCRIPGRGLTGSVCMPTGCACDRGGGQDPWTCGRAGGLDLVGRANGGQSEQPREHRTTLLARMHLFLTAFRSMPTANAEGKIGPEGGVGKVSVRRVFRYFLVGTVPLIGC